MSEAANFLDRFDLRIAKGQHPGTAYAAVFSTDPGRKYRYHLMREWLIGSGVCVFVMLNPSTADALANDPTVTRCVRFAQSWGYQKLKVVNLFALRATNPREIRTAEDPIGPDNDRWIVGTCKGADMVVCAWGAGGAFQERWLNVLTRLVWENIPVHYLTLLESGQPGHPLYLPAELQPKPLELPRCSPVTRQSATDRWTPVRQGAI